MLVVSERALEEHGLVPRARIHHLSVRGADPIFMLTAPIPATAYALDRTGMSLDGVHPALAVHRLLANDLIAVINTKYGTSLAPVP